jgi:hypothetical protein
LYVLQEMCSAHFLQHIQQSSRAAGATTSAKREILV